MEFTASGGAVSGGESEVFKSYSRLWDMLCDEELWKAVEFSFDADHDVEIQLVECAFSAGYSAGFRICTPEDIEFTASGGAVGGGISVVNLVKASPKKPRFVDQSLVGTFVVSGMAGFAPPIVEKYKYIEITFALNGTRYYDSYFQSEEHKPINVSMENTTFKPGKPTSVYLKKLKKGPRRGPKVKMNKLEVVHG